jgi:hypothetical protein
MAVLKNWEITDRFGKYVLFGEIVSDDKDRFEVGDKIFTSPIRRIDFTEDDEFEAVAFTKSGTRYDLEHM